MRRADPIKRTGTGTQDRVSCAITYGNLILRSTYHPCAVSLMFVCFSYFE